jgi:peptidoglycan/LPS O-acetylase OafA/YrhL
VARGHRIFSYSIYLVHAPLLHLSWFALRQIGLNDDLNFLVLALICVQIIVVLSYGFHFLFERPFMRLKPKRVAAPMLA